MIIKRKNINFVLELSSSAVKKLKPGGYREQIRTKTLDMVGPDKILDKEKFKETVIPAIKKLWESRGGECIATALYREIKNQQEILDLIKEETGIDVKVISGMEEAELVGKAILNQFPNAEKILFIDSGTRSVEVGLMPEGYFKSYKKDGPLILDNKLKDLRNDKNLLIVITGAAASKVKEPTLDSKVFKWHGKLQEVIRQIGIHPMVGSNATPGAGYLGK